MGTPIPPVVSPPPPPSRAPAGNMAEMTIKAVATGVVMGVVFGVANAYLGLRVGMTVSASIPAAVLSGAVFSLLRSRATILEANISQTIGSASTSLASGTIFTIPALFLWTTLHYDHHRPTDDTERLEPETIDFSTPEGFFKLWNFCKEQEWWVGFWREVDTNFGISTILDLINPDTFADAIYKFKEGGEAIG